MDENISSAVKTILESAGHRASTATEEGLGGSTDPEVFGRCQEEGLVLLTLDLDFSNIRSYPPGTHHGIVVLRLRTQGVHAVSAAVRRFISFLSELGGIEGATVIVEEGRVRVRRGSQPNDS